MNNSRILAVDLRAQRFGFAVLESREKLLDFGRKNYLTPATRDAGIVFRKRMAHLMGFFAPTAIVVKRLSGHRNVPSLRIEKMQEIINDEARARLIPVVTTTRKDIKRAFEGTTALNKHGIATLVAETLPELIWKLPQNRKNWQPEHHNMLIFDAVSIAFAYFHQLSKEHIQQSDLLLTGNLGPNGILPPAPADV